MGRIIRKQTLLSVLLWQHCLRKKYILVDVVTGEVNLAVTGLTIAASPLSAPDISGAAKEIHTPCLPDYRRNTHCLHCCLATGIFYARRMYYFVL